MAVTQSYSCGCVGPQRGEPLCPCKMRGVVQRKGRWVQVERDLGPVQKGLGPEYLSALQGLGQVSSKKQS